MGNNIKIYEQLSDKIDKLPINSISNERKEVLQVLIDYVNIRLKNDQAIKLNFICTHNSRRSQFSQIWAQTAAAYYGIDVKSYSGGVEVTAFNERAVESIRRAGFRVTKKGEDNPKYFVFLSDDAEPIVTFSKVYDDSINPQAGFAAIMTCSHADENCPFIPGAEARLPVRYEDPKAFDNTPEEATMYDERSSQIASEMFYVFSQIKKIK